MQVSSSATRWCRAGTVVRQPRSTRAGQTYAVCRSWTSSLNWPRRTTTPTRSDPWLWPTCAVAATATRNTTPCCASSAPRGRTGHLDPPARDATRTLTCDGFGCCIRRRQGLDPRVGLPGPGRMRPAVEHNTRAGDQAARGGRAAESARLSGANQKLPPDRRESKTRIAASPNAHRSRLTPKTPGRRTMILRRSACFCRWARSWARPKTSSPRSDVTSLDVRRASSSRLRVPAMGS